MWKKIRFFVLFLFIGFISQAITILTVHLLLSYLNINLYVVATVSIITNGYFLLHWFKLTEFLNEYISDYIQDYYITTAQRKAALQTVQNGYDKFIFLGINQKPSFEILKDGHIERGLILSAKEVLGKI